MFFCFSGESNNVRSHYSPGLPSFDVGLGGDADLPSGGGVLVLGLESGVRGILGLDSNALSNSVLKHRK